MFWPYFWAKEYYRTVRRVAKVDNYELNRLLEGIRLYTQNIHVEDPWNVWYALKVNPHIIKHVRRITELYASLTRTYLLVHSGNRSDMLLFDILLNFILRKIWHIRMQCWMDRWKELERCGLCGRYMTTDPRHRGDEGDGPRHYYRRQQNLSRKQYREDRVNRDQSARYSVRKYQGLHSQWSWQLRILTCRFPHKLGRWYRNRNKSPNMKTILSFQLLDQRVEGTRNNSRSGTETLQ